MGTKAQTFLKGLTDILPVPWKIGVYCLSYIGSILIPVLIHQQTPVPLWLVEVIISLILLIFLTIVIMIYKKYSSIPPSIKENKPIHIKIPVDVEGIKWITTTFLDKSIKLEPIPQHHGQNFNISLKCKEPGCNKFNNVNDTSYEKIYESAFKEISGRNRKNEL